MQVCKGVFGDELSAIFGPDGLFSV
eukprot:SAG31_NODE_41911_length_274_cov_0.577143_2_plen_24_part_01